MALQDRLDKIETMEDLFVLTMQLTKSSTNVATLAYVDSWSKDKSEKYYIVSVKPFPLKEEQEESVITCYCNNEIGKKLTKDDILIVVFMDLDFRRSLNNNSIDQVNDEICHTMNTGVIVGYLYMKEK